MLIQKTVYIREEDIEAWNNVSNKAQFMHDALNRIPASEVVQKDQTPRAKRVTAIVESIEDQKIFTKAALFASGDCPRHHVPLELCKDKH